MLRVNVGMSRKLTKDFQSTGFSVNLDGEVCIPLDDPEAVIEKIREFYDVCDEALRDQIERYESTSAIASRDEEPRHDYDRSANTPSQENFNDRRSSQRNPGHRNGNGNGNGNGNRNKSSNTPQPATNKQIQFLLNLSKQKGMSKHQLENRIAGILGRECDVYDLSKSDAGTILDTLTADNGNRSRRR
ncbi:MAG: hypothetical protein IH899_17410 [Planctomycetes bacterium]|nr:hypothetical protein [Planctomycetota bacterium]